MTNQSQLNLNVLLYIDAPFYLINDKKKLVHKKKIILPIDTSMTISVKFSPNINFNDPYSRNYSDALWFKYNEHPNKVKFILSCYLLFVLYFVKFILQRNKFAQCKNFAYFRIRFNVKVL